MTSSASAVSSKPTIERSSGIAEVARQRRLHRADRQLVVEREDRARRFGELEQRGCGGTSAVDVEVRLDHQVGVRHHAGGGQRGAVAACAFLGGQQRAGPGDRRDPPVAELEQMSGGLVGAGGVGGGYRRDVTADPLARVDDDEAEALAAQRPQLTAGLLWEDEQAAVGGSVDQALEQRDLAVVLVERRTEHDPHVLLIERIGDAGDDQREVGGVDPRHRDADQAGAPAGEAARRSVGRVPVLADHAARRPDASAPRRSRCG